MNEGSLRCSLADVSCAICLDILCDPLTVHPCGHSFCAHCLHTWLERGKARCPTCERPMASAALCFALKSVVEHEHAESLAARREQLGVAEPNAFAVRAETPRSAWSAGAARVREPIERFNEWLLDEGQRPGAAWRIMRVFFHPRYFLFIWVAFFLILWPPMFAMMQWYQPLDGVDGVEAGAGTEADAECDAPLSAEPVSGDGLAANDGLTVLQASTMAVFHLADDILELGGLPRFYGGALGVGNDDPLFARASAASSLAMLAKFSAGVFCTVFGITFCLIILMRRWLQREAARHVEWEPWQEPAAVAEDETGVAAE